MTEEGEKENAKGEKCQTRSDRSSYGLSSESPKGIKPIVGKW
jgi:hypothetical protein